MNNIYIMSLRGAALRRRSSPLVKREIAHLPLRAVQGSLAEERSLAMTSARGENMDGGRR